jgi:hypothetical protein
MTVNTIFISETIFLKINYLPASHRGIKKLKRFFVASCGELNPISILIKKPNRFLKPVRSKNLNQAPAT